MTSKLRFLVRFDGDYVTTKELMTVSKLLEETMAQINQELLIEMLDGMKMHEEIKKLVKNEAMKSMKEDFEQENLGIRATGNGSIWLDVAINAVPMVAVTGALLKFFGDAFKKSEPYKQAQEYIIGIFNQIGNRIYLGASDKAKKHKDKIKVNPPRTLPNMERFPDHIEGENIETIEINIKVRYSKESPDEKFNEYDQL